VAHRVAEGDGPVNALDSALRLTLGKFFPQLKKVRLTDYKVRILSESFHSQAKETRDALGKKNDLLTATLNDLVTSSNPGTAAKTRVLIESTDGKDEWGTVGVSTNIIEASLQALVDSLEYGLLKKK
jgi:2-isopropylmalate synthase